MTQTYMMCQRIDTCWMTASWMTPRTFHMHEAWMMNWPASGTKSKDSMPSYEASNEELRASGEWKESTPLLYEVSAMDSRLVEWTGYREHPHGRTLTSPGMLNIQQSQLRNFCYRVVGMTGRMS